MTVALDTNVLVRFVLRDDPQQWQAANDLILAEQVTVSATVWLEFEWVLRGVYGFARTDVNKALRGFFGLESLSTDCGVQLAQALEWHEQGMDFADAFHLAYAGPFQRLATFDRDFSSRANKLQSRIEVITP